MDLTQQKCVPCQGSILPLARAQAEEQLAKLDGWQLAEDTSKISKTYTFPDFKATLAFVNQIGALAEAEGHHPEITFTWGRATIRLWTHKIHGLHLNDFILAAKIDQLR